MLFCAPLRTIALICCMSSTYSVRKVFICRFCNVIFCIVFCYSTRSVVNAVLFGIFQHNIYTKKYKSKPILQIYLIYYLKKAFNLQIRAKRKYKKLQQLILNQVFVCEYVRIRYIYFSVSWINCFRKICKDMVKDMVLISNDVSIYVFYSIIIKKWNYCYSSVLYAV